MDSYSIYQVKEQDGTEGLLFEPLGRLRTNGRSVERGNYNLVYTGLLPTERDPVDMTLEALFQNFNIAHPADFRGHSLSVSDIVVLRLGDILSAHYVDSIGFAEVPEFLYGPYVYYSTQRPIDIGTFPKTQGGPEHMERFDRRVPVEDGAFEAWGLLLYPNPLTEEQVMQYELRAASSNPDLYQFPPRQLQARTQIVGEWEQEKNLPVLQRMTEQEAGTGLFRMKDNVNPLQLTVRFDRVRMDI